MDEFDFHSEKDRRKNKRQRNLQFKRIKQNKQNKKKKRGYDDEQSYS